MPTSPISPLRFPLFALCALVLAACGDRSSAPQAPPVWRLEQGETTVYLFGSAHALTPDAAWRSLALEAALDDAELVLFELTPGPQTQAQAQALYESLGRNPPGVRLSALIAPTDQARLQRVALQLGLDPDALEPLRPWAAAQQIAFAAALRQGADPALGVEAVLAQELTGRPAAGLETPHSQLALMAGLSLERENRLLSLTLQQAEEQPQLMVQAQALWLSGDADAIAALSEASFKAVDAAFYAALIVERNEAFAEAVEARLTGRDEDVLIVVGAAHMGGEDGVIAILRARGYHVEGP